MMAQGNAQGYRIGLGPGYRIGRAELAAGLSLRPSGEAIIRYYIAGFGRTVINAGAAGVPTTGALTRPFRGERLVIPSDVAGAFSVTNLQSGNDSVFVSPNGAPARSFVEGAADVALEFPTTIAAIAITINVTNNSGANQTFEGLVLGYAAVLN